MEVKGVEGGNGEMEKGGYNVVGGLCEEDKKGIVWIEEEGWGGEVNCLWEVVEEKGGLIDMEKVGMGEESLCGKEIMGKECEEGMGLVIEEWGIEDVEKIGDGEGGGMYRVGERRGEGGFGGVWRVGEGGEGDWGVGVGRGREG